MSHPNGLRQDESPRPRVSLEEAKRIFERVYPDSSPPPAILSELDSERDRNFRVETGQGRFVLKVAARSESDRRLEWQNRALALLGAVGGDGPHFPELVASAEGSPITNIRLDGHDYRVRLVRWVEGRPLARMGAAPTGRLLEDLGRLLGEVDGALAGMEAPERGHEFAWESRAAPATILERLSAVREPARRAFVERHLEQACARLQPADALPIGWIHGDANDHNVLVTRDSRGTWSVSGLIDFGDMVHSWLAAEPAVAAAYAMSGREDPVGVACAIVRGYHAARPLAEAEADVVFELARLRLLTSVVMSAWQRMREPDNEYLSVSEGSAWATLERLSTVPADLARYRIRAACGLAPVARGARVESLLRELTPSPVLEAATPSATWHRLDLDIGRGIDGGLDPNDQEAYTRVLFDALAASGADIGVGAYDEVRGWYTGPAFRAPGVERSEWRTVHLGVDLYRPPGESVRAPLEGTVAAVADNAGSGDYGPTVILEHRVAAGDGGAEEVFWTLFGHLSPWSLDHLEPGDRVNAGEKIGEIGDRPGNGDWAPHLHLQLILDRLGFEGTFPGVAAPSQRDAWLSISPDPDVLLRIPGGDRAPGLPRAPELERRRRDVLGSGLSLSYGEPLHLVRGRGTRLYDADGQPYLDCVNNVAHVGHSHPHVVEAAAGQARRLNTNSRYLHEVRIAYAERLLALFPAPLEVCWFVNSGSEANELALRLARTHTGRQGVMACEAGYHGNTGTLVDVSHYKFAGAGGRGPPEWVETVPLPDVYRGIHRAGASDEGDPAAAYSRYVPAAADRLAARGFPPAAWLIEPLIGCGGQIVPPRGYLAASFAAARAAGAVAIADEVQIGFGRVGSHWWAFERDAVVPDIVTLGKPIGNGHPMGAVLSTRAVADSFRTGMEYFSTFGGNPVSAATGMAVLDVIESEGLRENARSTGDRLRIALEGLADRHSLIGDVRGAGLYLGVELVADREARTPAPEAAAAVVEHARRLGVLLSTDGPDHNVIKIKPPICFSPDDADWLLDALDEALAALN